MVKQRGLGESNQKELTQKGTNIKKKSSHQERGSRHSTANRAECFLVGVGDLADCELDCSAAVSTDKSCGDLVVRNCHVVSNRHVVLNRPLRRPRPSASFWGPVSSLNARTVVVGARSVTRLLAGYNCTVRAHCRELRRLSRCLSITARGRHVWLFFRVTWETMTRIVQRVQSQRCTSAKTGN